MRRMMRSAALWAGLAVAMAGGLPAVAQAAPVDRPAFHGREVYHIVTTRPGPRLPVVTASGAFKATGTFVRKNATLAFPRGRIIVSRHVTSTIYPRPDLATCRFKIIQKGTFTVTKATGKYRGLRESGDFSTTIRGRYNRTGPSRCGRTMVTFRAGTYEIGTVS
jgi:hypothetical protein